MPRHSATRRDIQMNQTAESPPSSSSTSTTWRATLYLGDEQVDDWEVRSGAKRGLAVSFVNRKLTVLRADHGPDAALRGHIQLGTYLGDPPAWTPDTEGGAPIESHAAIDADGVITWTD